MSADQVRWHQVGDLDLARYLEHEDSEVAAAAREEQLRRISLAGGPSLFLERRSPDDDD